MTPQPTLRTPRLVLRAFRESDAPAVEAIVSQRLVADTTLSIPHPYPEGGAHAWLATHADAWAAGQHATWAVTEREGGTLVGAISLKLVPAHARAEVGYWIAPSHWGHGYATEAARVVVGYGFAALGLHRVEGRHFPRNAASGRVMQKIGMRAEGVQRGAVRKDGVFEDLAAYAVLADEWTGLPND